MKKNIFIAAVIAAIIWCAAANADGLKPSASSNLVPVSTNFNVGVLYGCAVGQVNGIYTNYNWLSITNQACTNINGLTIYGGGTTSRPPAITTYPLEIDLGGVGGGVNLYYATNFSTNISQVTWFIGAGGAAPAPVSSPLISYTTVYFGGGITTNIQFVDTTILGVSQTNTFWFSGGILTNYTKP